jgi:hypothetical protein
MLAPLFPFTDVTLRYDRGPIFRALRDFAFCDFVFHGFMSREFTLHESSP